MPYPFVSFHFIFDNHSKISGGAQQYIARNKRNKSRGEKKKKGKRMEPNLNMSLVYRNKIYTYVQLYGVWTGREELAELFFLFFGNCAMGKTGNCKVCRCERTQFKHFFLSQETHCEIIWVSVGVGRFYYTVCFFLNISKSISWVGCWWIDWPKRRISFFFSSNIWGAQWLERSPQSKINMR